MESKPTLKVNPIYEGKNTADIDTFLGYLNLPDDAWKKESVMEPKKASDPQVWAWKRTSKTSKTEVQLKVRCVFPNMTMDKLLECFQPENIPKWNEQFPKMKIIQENPEDDTYLTYATSKAVAILDLREFVSRTVHRKGYYINEDGSDAAHISFRVPGGEHADYPSNVKGLTRGIEHCTGQMFKPAPEVNGCMVEAIHYKDIFGKIPEFIIEKASNK